MSRGSTSLGPTFEVLDAFDHPHGGRILRVRAEGGSGTAPPLRKLRGAEIRAISPEGSERRATILSFPVTGGRPSDDRFHDTGRLDLLVRQEGEGPPISLDWRLRIEDA